MVILKVVTLNCWGIEVPFVSKFRSERMEAICDLFSKSDYDVIFLEEVWSNSDFKKICDRLGHILPYSHYFHSGFIGSGVCIFSKFQIIETLFHRFQINGFPHKLQHGDWFGGKGMGMCQILVDGFKVNLYITHLHAEYSRTHDIYLAHRIAQSFEGSQFIKHTSQNCDFMILGGDLNIRTEDIGYKLFISIAGLADSWIDKKASKTICEGNTCDRKDNIFTALDAPDFPAGQRIDYLLYRNNKGCSVSVEECDVLSHQVPDKHYRISDHEAVTATFKIQKSDSGGLDETITSVGRNQHLQDSLEKLEKGMEDVRYDRKYFGVLIMILIAILYMVSLHDEYLGLMFMPFATIFEIGIIAIIAFLVIYSIVIKLSEENALYSIKLDILNLLGKPVKTTEVN